MTRINELQKKYPNIPRDVIVKYDAMIRGIRANEDLDKASVWRRALSSGGSGDTYQSKDYDGGMREVAEKTPWRVKPGFVLRASDIRFKNGLGCETRLRSTSTYTVKEESEGKYALYDGEERVHDIYFARHKSTTASEPVTSRGTPISTLIAARPVCAWMMPSRYCQYFSTGEQCKFCNYNTGHEDARSIGLDVPLAINLEETIEAYKIRCSEVRLVEAGFVMGGFMKADQEAKIYLDFVEKLAAATTYKPNFTIHTQAMERRDIQRLKDAGLDAFQVQIEVMDPKLFAEICPGKAKHMPYERWLEGIMDAVDVLGVGNAGGKIVPGVTLLSPNGHKTWQEARDYHIEANTYMIKNGIFPSFVPLWWAPGAIYSQDSANLAKFPPTEYYLEVAQAHHEAMLEYGLYEKMNKFLHCALDCMGSYMGDIGILTSAEDVGAWISDVVPEESNWLARFVESVKSSAGADLKD